MLSNFHLTLSCKILFKFIDQTTKTFDTFKITLHVRSQPLLEVTTSTFHHLYSSRRFVETDTAVTSATLEIS